MPALKATLFRDYFGGSWACKVYKNGEFQRDIVFNWPTAFARHSSMGTAEGLVVPPGEGVLDDTPQVAVAGWRSDLLRWCHTWHNEFGGFGELQWTSQEVINGTTVIYGFGHECKQEVDDPNNIIIQCEILGQDKFRYSIQSFRKGLVEIESNRLRSAEALNALLQMQAGTVSDFWELALT